MSVISRPAEYRLHRPHPRLAAASQPSPRGELHQKANVFFQREVETAYNGRSAKRSQPAVVVFGPNQFDDFPLKSMLERGAVYGLDISREAMVAAKKDLPRGLRRRLAALQLDASLYANRLIDLAAGAIHGHYSLSENLFEKLVNGIKTLRPEGKLPFNDNSFDLAVSISAASQFAIAAYNESVALQIEKFGQASVYDFYTAEIETDGGRMARGQLLDQTVGELARKIALTHLREMARLVRPGGTIYWSDHSFKTEAVNGAGFFPLYPEDLWPHDRLAQNLRLKTDRPMLTVDVGTRAKGVAVVGGDSLTELAGEVAGVEKIDDYSFWNVNSQGFSMFGVPGTYFLDSAVVLRSIK